jgi:nucleotide-binding universal stress UspA family protein
MARKAAPVLVGYDASELSKAAVRHAADLFPERPTMLVTVWEPGLATMSLGPVGTYDAGMAGMIPPDPAMTEAVDRAQREHASRVAAEGAELARSLGLAAEPHVVPDELDVADTLIALASERNAAVVVVGSQGMSWGRSRLLGGVSRKLIEQCDRPVLVIRGDST